MEIDNYTLLAYFIAWSIFYFFLSHYIAELSRKRWTNWVESEESDETKKAQNLDPMNGIRKAAKDGDWTSMLVEYAANKANLSQFVGQKALQNVSEKQKESPKLGLK